MLRFQVIYFYLIIIKKARQECLKCPRLLITGSLSICAKPASFAVRRNFVAPSRYGRTAMVAPRLLITGSLPHMRKTCQLRCQTQLRCSCFAYMWAVPLLHRGNRKRSICRACKQSLQILLFLLSL